MITSKETGENQRALIMDPYEAYSDILSTRTNQIQDKVIPIYAPNAKDVPICVGTGNLVECQSRKFIITAGHVIKENHFKQKLTLYLPANKTIRPIETQAQISADKHAKDIYDPFDICVLEVDSETEKEIEAADHNFLHFDNERDARFDGENFIVCFLGFPLSHNKGYNGKIKPKPYSFRSNLIKDVKLDEMIQKGIFDKIKGILPSTHYVISFKKSQVVKDSGERTTFPSKHGMSGSGLYTLSHIGIEAMMADHFENEIIGIFHSGIEIDYDETLLIFTNHLAISHMVQRFL